MVYIQLEKNANGPVAGDISPNGREILLKTYNNVYLYTQADNQEHVGETLSRQPKRLYYNVEKQGESIAWDPHGQGFYTISEGKHPAIWYYTPLQVDTNHAPPAARPAALCHSLMVVLAAYTFATEWN